MDCDTIAMVGGRYISLWILQIFAGVITDGIQPRECETYIDEIYLLVSLLPDETKLEYFIALKSIVFPEF